MNNFIEFYWSLWMKQLKKMKSNSLPVASNMWTTLRYLEVRENKARLENLRVGVSRI